MLAYGQNHKNAAYIYSHLIVLIINYWIIIINKFIILINIHIIEFNY